MRRRRLLKVGLWVLGLGALLVALGAALEAWLVPAGIRAAAARAVRDAAGDTARIQDVRVNLWRGHIVMTHLEANGLALASLQVDATLDELRLHIGRRALLRGKLEVQAVTLLRPVLTVRPVAAPTAPRPSVAVLAAPLGAGRLTVRDGRATYEGGGRGLRLEVVGFEGTATRRPEGIAVALRFGEGRLAAAGRTLSLGPLAVDGLWRTGGSFDVASLTLAGLGSTLKGRGHVSLKGWPASPPKWDLTVEGVLDAGAIAALAGTGTPAAGQVAYGGAVRGTGRDASFAGQVEAGTFTLGQHTARSVAGGVAVDGRRIRRNGLRAVLWGGVVRVSGACVWASDQCEMQGEGQGIDLAQPVPGAGTRGRAAGTGTFTGVPRRADTHRIALSLRGREVQVGTVPLGGVTAEIRLDDNRVEAEGSTQGGAIPFRLSGPWRPELAVDVAAGPADAGALAKLLGQPGLGGTLRAAGTLAGPWADPSFMGRIVWAPAEAAGVTWDSAEGTVQIGAGRFAMEAATLRVGRTVLSLRGTARPGPRMDSGPASMILDLAGEGEGAVKDLGGIAGQALAAAGHFRATVRIRGSLRRPEGDAQLVLRDLVVGSSRWERGEARTRLVAGSVRLEAVTLVQGAARLEVKGEVAPGGRLALDLTASDLDLGALAASPGLAGRLSGKGRVTGTATDPAVDATVRFAALSWEGMALGDLRGRLTRARGRTEVGLREEGGRLSLTGVLPGAAEGTAEVAFTVQEMDVSPLLARTGVPRLAAGRARAGGTARLAVPLARPQDATGEARLAPAEIRLAGETWSAEGPLEVRLAPEGVQIPGAALRGRLGIVRLSGAVPRDGRVDLAIQGPVPLATAALWAGGIEGTGTVNLNLGVSGVAGAAETHGTVHLAAGRMRVGGVPWELANVDCPMTLEEKTAIVGPGRAVLAGGTLTGTGRLQRLGLREWEHRWAVRLEGAEAAQLVGAFGPASGKITGGAGGTAELVFVAGEGSDPIRSLGGPVQLRFQDGRLFRSSLLGRVLEVVNVTPLRRWRLPDLQGEGMPYREVTAGIQIERGVAEVRELRLESDAVRMAGAGSMDLGSREVQLLVAVRPLSALDDVVGRVPVLGPALVGKDGGVLTLSYEVSGPLDDPAVRLASARPIGRNLLDKLRKLLE